MREPAAQDQDLARLRGLAEEQAALRRVATLVASDPEPRRVFECVCLTNAARHARASSVSVRLRYGDGLLSIEVRDDGVGGADVGSGSGLRGLCDRLEALGGRLEIDSPPDAGTTLAGHIPVDASRVAG